MPNPPKARRNAQLVQMRYSGVSWSVIACRFIISEATACKIFKRDSSAEGRYEQLAGVSDGVRRTSSPQEQGQH